VSDRTERDGARVHQPLSRHESLGDMLLHISVAAVETLHADMAGLTLLHPDGRPTTAIFTDDTAPEIDQAQYASNRGPCLQAFRSKAVFRVDVGHRRRGDRRTQPLCP
jgi:hypothetical protein